MMGKYEFTGEIMDADIDGRECTLRRIRAISDFGKVKKGDIGGWIETVNNLAGDGLAWVSGSAMVSDKALVDGDAQVTDEAVVSGDSWVGDKAIIKGRSKVGGNAEVCGNAQICRNAVIKDHAIILDNAYIGGDIVVEGHTSITGKTVLTGKAHINGSPLIDYDVDTAAEIFAEYDKMIASKYGEG